MVAGMAVKGAVVLVASSLTCLTICTLKVETVHVWMMRHHCPIAGLATHPPSRTIVELRRPATRR